MPHSGQVIWDTAEAARNCSKKNHVEIQGVPTSLPTAAFNTLLAEALDRNEFDHDIDMFAMLHADVAPEGPWLDVLIDEMMMTNADIVSAVNVIKDDRAVTSSGVSLPGVPWLVWRRFTLTELAEYPETFNQDDIGFGGMALLHNTGCWVADVRKPIFHEEEEIDGLLHTRAFFTVNDRIVRKSKEVRRKAEVEPEDWFFSRRLHELGVNGYITRKVVTNHWGLAGVNNRDIYGLPTDVQVTAMWAEKLKEVADACQ